MIFALALQLFSFTCFWLRAVSLQYDELQINTNKFTVWGVVAGLAPYLWTLLTTFVGGILNG